MHDNVIMEHAHAYYLRFLVEFLKHGVNYTQTHKQTHVAQERCVGVSRQLNMNPSGV